MKNPLAVFTSVAAVAAAAVGGTVYMNRVPQAPQQLATQVEQAQSPEKAPEIKVLEPAAEAPKVAEAAPAEAPKVAEAAPAEAPKVAEAAPVEAPKVAEAAPAEAPKVADAAPVEAPKVAEAAPAEAPKTAETEVAVVAPKAETPAAPAAVEPVVPSLPSFDTVRVEATGDAVIAGRAEPDSDVTVKWNGNIVGATKANADGSFVLIPAKPLATGIGAMTIEMDKGGTVTKSEGSVFVVVQKDAPAMVAKVDPIAPTEVVQPAAEAGASEIVQLTAVDYDLKGNIVFSGRATPGGAVRFYVDNNPMGEGRADTAGSWRFEGNSSVTPGTHTLRADAVDADGKVTSRIELPFLREDAQTVAAAQVAKLEAKKKETVVTRSVVAEAAPAADAPAAPKAVATAETAPVVEPAPAPKAEATAEAAPAPVAETKTADADPAAPAAEAPAVLTAEVGPRTLVIQPGNNLWKLSREVYGKGRMYTVIYKANKGQIRNPNRIYPGQILTAPASE